MIVTTCRMAGQRRPKPPPKALIFWVDIPKLMIPRVGPPAALLVHSPGQNAPAERYQARTRAIPLADRQKDTVFLERLLWDMLA